MQEAALTEWINSPETQHLVALLRRRRASAVQTFLAGQPVDPVTQGRAAELHELEKLLASPVEKIREVFETALRENKV